MGYSSDITSTIYGDPDKVCALVMKFKHTDAFDLWATGAADAFGEYMQEYDAEVRDHATDGTRMQRFIVMHGEGWKWYDDFLSVKAWGRFLDMAEEMGLNGEFVRIGENIADIEQRRFGDGCEYLLGVSISITEELPAPPEPSTKS